MIRLNTKPKDINLKGYIAVDTENRGFDPFTSEMLTVQIGNYDVQHIIDLTKHNIKDYKNILENNPLILQNAKYDLRFFYNHGVFPTKIWDTMLAEQKLYQGYISVRKNLQALEERYCDSSLVDKGDRGLIHREGLTDRVIKYCAYDIKVLPEIMEKQVQAAKDKEMLRAIELENNFCLSLAYAEFCGVYLNDKKWLDRARAQQTKLIKAKKACDDYVRNHNKLTRFVDTQMDLFNPNADPTVVINWNSDKQVKKVFKILGIDVKVTKDGEEKESIDAKVLERQIGQFDILPVYLEYKTLQKDVSTYGEAMLRHINPITGRIHTSYNQIMDTGRISSGGKQGKVENLNLQNIPNNELTRNCFTPEKDNHDLVNSDYHAQEDVVFVNKSKEKNLIAFHKGENSDGHSYVAKLCFKDKLKSVHVDDIKKKYPDLRNLAKKAKFAIHYGGTGYTIANNLGLTQAEGDSIESKYYKAFPDIDEYFTKCENFVLDNGYILIDEVTGSKYYIEGFDKFKELHKKYTFDNRIYWDKYKEEKRANTRWYKREKEKISHYFRWKGHLRRIALNYVIQGTAASITKIAVYLFFKWIMRNNYLNIVKIVLLVHDEVVVECPTTLSKEVSKNLQYYMEKAGDYYCDIIPLKADPVISKVWEH